MSESESDIQAKILGLGRGDVRLFRTNAGKAWVAQGGRPSYITHLGVKGVFLPGGRPIMLLPKGTPDTCGGVSVVIGPDMVGQRVMIAAMIEVKDAKGKLNPDQRAALAEGKRLGVRCGVARSVEDADEILVV